MEQGAISKIFQVHADMGHSDGSEQANASTPQGSSLASSSNVARGDYSEIRKKVAFPENECNRASNQ